VVKDNNQYRRTTAYLHMQPLLAEPVPEIAGLMWGFAGVVALRDALERLSVEQLAAMAGALRHRGSDDAGVYRDERAGFNHARLSVIHLTTGQQPLSNEEGTLWITFNGEIFNYVEPREELVGLSHRFRTRTDTEVVVHDCEAWGEKAFDRFNGQRAAALWNSRERTLVLARDSFGVRPLLVCEHAGRIDFASEVKAIFAASSAIPRALCERKSRQGSRSVRSYPRTAWTRSASDVSRRNRALATEI